MEVVYEDNHIIIVNKECGEIVQGDKTGDTPLSVTVADYIKRSAGKPGNAFIGVVHRIDRPVSGLVIFAKTSKALSRLCDMLRKGQIHKTYRAIVCGAPHKDSDTLTGWMGHDTRLNKSWLCNEEKEGTKRVALSYRTIARGEHYTMLEISLMTGRHHQIRCQLAAIGCPIKGDLKYGAPRSNRGGGISLTAYSVELIHPVKKTPLKIVAPLPHDTLWATLLNTAESRNNGNAPTTDGDHAPTADATNKDSAPATGATGAPHEDHTRPAHAANE